MIDIDLGITREEAPAVDRLAKLMPDQWKDWGSQTFGAKAVNAAHAAKAAEEANTPALSKDEMEALCPGCTDPNNAHTLDGATLRNGSWTATERNPDVAPPLTQDTTALIMSEICQHEPGAWDWWKSYLEVVLTWDHIMDGDPVDSAMADRAFLALLTQWPFNPFFNKSKLILVPVMVNAISAWRYSDTPGAPKVKAYDCCTEMATTVAYIIGGQAMVDRYVPELRKVSWEICLDNAAKDGGRK